MRATEGPQPDAVLGPSERLPGRPFTDAQQSQSDLRVMSAMLAREREIARAWSPDSDGPGITETTREHGRELLIVPDGRALVAARDVTAVGFFGTLRDGVDHSVLFAHEREIARTLPEYAAHGFLSYFDVGLEHGRYGNLVLFRAPGVPAAWRANPAHRPAVACAPEHYAHIRLHKGRIPGPVLGGGRIVIEQTLYLEYRGAVTWRAVRSYGARRLTLT